MQAFNSAGAEPAITVLDGTGNSTNPRLTMRASVKDASNQQVLAGINIYKISGGDEVTRMGVLLATPQWFLLTGLVVNDSGADSDTRIEGHAEPNLFFVDAGTDRVGIGTDAPGSRLHVEGGPLWANGGLRVRYSTSVQALATTDVYYGVRANNTTVTLPTAASMAAGRVVIIKDETGTNSPSITVQCASGDTIQGQTQKQFTGQYDVKRLISDGGNQWFEI